MRGSYRLADWELFIRLNELLGRRTLRRDGAPRCDAEWLQSMIDDARRLLERRLDGFDLPFDVPDVQVFFVLWPSKGEPSESGELGGGDTPGNQVLSGTISRRRGGIRASRRVDSDCVCVDWHVPAYCRGRSSLPECGPVCAGPRSGDEQLGDARARRLTPADPIRLNAGPLPSVPRADRGSRRGGPEPRQLLGLQRDFSLVGEVPLRTPEARLASWATLS